MINLIACHLVNLNNLFKAFVSNNYFLPKAFIVFGFDLSFSPIQLPVKLFSFFGGFFLSNSNLTKFSFSKTYLFIFFVNVV